MLSGGAVLAFLVVAVYLVFQAAVWFSNRVGVAGDVVYVRGRWGRLWSGRSGPCGDVLSVWTDGTPVYLLLGPAVVPLRWGYNSPVYPPGEEAMLARLGRRASVREMLAHLCVHNRPAYWAMRLYLLIGWAGG